MPLHALGAARRLCRQRRLSLTLPGSQGARLEVLPTLLLAFSYTMYILNIYETYMEIAMGIVNIDDDLHDQVRRATKVSCRSINAQAAYWIRVGMLCETNPTLSFNEIIKRELSSAGVSAQPLAVSEA
jgi:hypothetical protein